MHNAVVVLRVASSLAVMHQSCCSNPHTSVSCAGKGIFFFFFLVVVAIVAFISGLLLLLFLGGGVFIFYLFVFCLTGRKTPTYLLVFCYVVF